MYMHVSLQVAYTSWQVLACPGMSYQVTHLYITQLYVYSEHTGDIYAYTSVGKQILKVCRMFRIDYVEFR